MPDGPSPRIKAGLGPTSSLTAFVASPNSSAPNHPPPSMKFSFATAFLTLTAASAVVFAAPAQDDNSSATRYSLYASFVSHRRAD